jgi:hypothetical protein
MPSGVFHPGSTRASAPLWRSSRTNPVPAALAA